MVSGLLLGLAAWAVMLSLQMNPINDPTRFQQPAAMSAAVPASLRSGAEVYLAECASCHQNRGEGRFPVFPPLAGSARANADIAPLVAMTLHGLTGPIESNGVPYSGLMPGLSHLDDEDIAAVLSHVRSAWGNNSAPVQAADVKAIRSLTADRRMPWTAQELNALSTRAPVP